METPGLYTSPPKGSFRSLSAGRVLDILNTRLRYNAQGPEAWSLLSKLIKQTRRTEHQASRGPRPESWGEVEAQLEDLEVRKVTRKRTWAPTERAGVLVPPALRSG